MKWPRSRYNRDEVFAVQRGARVGHWERQPLLGWPFTDDDLNVRTQLALAKLEQFRRCDFISGTTKKPFQRPGPKLPGARRNK
jgi:hypothetical protein